MFIWWHFVARKLTESDTNGVVEYPRLLARWGSLVEAGTSLFYDAPWYGHSTATEPENSVLYVVTHRMP